MEVHLTVYDIVQNNILPTLVLVLVYFSKHLYIVYHEQFIGYLFIFFSIII